MITTNESAEYSRQIAETIIEQLGGNRFAVMTGARKFRYFENGVVFNIGRNCKSVNLVRVQLNGRDLYDVDYLRTRGMEVKTVASSNDLYFDMLQSDFTRNTGMDTHL